MNSDPISSLKKKEKSWMSHFPHIPVVLNQYETQINSNAQFFRVFEIKTEPEVQTDSYPIYSAAMKKMPDGIKQTLKETEYFGRRSYTIWYLAKTQLSKPEMDDLKAKPPTYNIQMEEGGEYKVFLKFVKQSKLTDKENMNLVAQFLNIRMKQLVLNKCKMKELCRNTFFPQWTQFYISEKYQVEARIGFRFNLEYFEIQLYCDINYRLRQMNQRTFLEVLKDKRQNLAYYVGKRVAKKYGDQKTHVIDKIDTTMTPLSKFNKNGTKISYVEYFKQNYQLHITDMNQPLIQVTVKMPAKIKTGGTKIEKITQTIYLVPELVSLVDISEHAKKTLKKELAMSPNEQISVANDFINEFNKNQREFKIFADNRRSYAQLLPDPKIELNQTEILKINEGFFRVVNQIYEPVELTDVLVVYSVGKNKAFDREAVDDTIKMLNRSGERYRIRIKEHFSLEVSEYATPQDWIKEVETDALKNGKPKFALFALVEAEINFYPILKEELIYRLGIDNQMFLRSKIAPSSKGALKIAGNIIKQVAAKKNQTLWKIHSIRNFEQKLVLIIGISVQKMGDAFEVVIARSVNKDVSKFKTKAYKIQSREIPDLILEQQFYSAMEDYIKNEKKKFKPTTVVVYRMGLNNEKFVEEHVQKEFGMLNSRVKYICEHKLKQPYFPELVFIQTIDKPSQKIWIEEQGIRQKNLLPSVLDPQVGTVMRGQSDKEFYLIPYKAMIGSVYPSLYKVLVNPKDVPMEYITQLTYAHTYMYYNWEGSVRLPQVLQLCKKAHQYVKAKEYKDQVFESPLYI